MHDLITLSDVARRCGVNRQAITRWRAAPDFPPITRQGRLALVSWSAVQRWRAEKDADREARAEAARYEGELRELRGRLWLRLRDLGGTEFASLVLHPAEGDLQEMRRLAAQFLGERFYGAT